MTPMCLTAEMLALFLNLLDPTRISTESGQITVHATEGDVEWQRVDDKWCTDARETADDRGAD